MFPLIRQWAVATLLCLAGAVSGSAAITATGDFSPAYDGVADPWDLGAEVDLYVGETAAGSLTIDGGSDIAARKAYFGYSSGGVGDVTISGDGSTVQTSSDLFVGSGGQGRLWLSDGGRAVVGGVTRIYRPNSSPTAGIHFDGGTLETGSLFTSPRFLQGEGVIYANGLVSDFDLTFDADHGTSQAFLFDSEPGQNVTLHLAQRVSTESFDYLGAGYRGHATLVIKDGRQIKSAYGQLGDGSGYQGTARISGVGTTWAVTDRLTIGGGGMSGVFVDQGGLLKAQLTSIGGFSASGALHVSGMGSLFTGMDFRLNYDSTFLVEDAAEAEIENYFSIGFTGWRIGVPSVSVATVRGQGSILAVDKGIIVGSGSQGQLRVEDGAQVMSYGLQVGSSSITSGELVVTGVGSRVEADSMRILPVSLASVGIGPFTSVLVEDGGLLKVNTKLQSYLLPTYAGSGFALRDGGMLALPGDNDDTLAQFLGATEIQALKYWDGDSYENLLLASLDIDYTLAYQASGELAGFTLLTVGVLPTIDGDYNGDGLVDAADYTVWRDQLDTDATLPGDTTPGSVTEGDYAIWAENYGSSSADAASSAVPEPGSLVLIGLTLLATTVGRKRDGRCAINPCLPAGACQLDAAK